MQSHVTLFALKVSGSLYCVTSMQTISLGCGVQASPMVFFVNMHLIFTVIKHPTRDAFLYTGEIQMEGAAGSHNFYWLQPSNHWLDSLQIRHMYAVALGRISEYGAMTF